MLRSRLLLTLCLVACCSAAAAVQSADLAARSKIASQAMNDGRFDEAAGIYRELLKALPDDPGLLMNLGMALAMGGHEQQALGPLERAVKLRPTLVPAHLFLGSSYLALGEPAKAIAPLRRVVAARPAEIEHRRMLAQAYADAGRGTEAVTELRRITEIAPKLPAGWFALGHAYNAVTQEAMATFEARPADAPWRQLLLADALLADGRFTDAFAIYRETQQALPEMRSIHDSIARIYERTGHADWAAVERRRGALPPTACTARQALCEFRAGRYRLAYAAALRGSDPESRYWRARAATELALAAFKQLEQLPDSRERREVRATFARAERRYTDAIADLKAALAMTPNDPGLLDDLGSTYYLARDFEQTVATLAPLVSSVPDDARLLTVFGDSLLQLQRVDEAITVLRRAVAADAADRAARLALARAYAQTGEHANAIPLIEPHLAQDEDGSIHVQMARAYTAIGQKERAAALLQRSQELQRAAQERSAAAAQRTITAPK